MSFEAVLGNKEIEFVVFEVTDSEISEDTIALDSGRFFHDLG
jgi:hypothetical protein